MGDSIRSSITNQNRQFDRLHKRSNFRFSGNKMLQVLSFLTCLAVLFIHVVGKRVYFFLNYFLKQNSALLNIPIYNNDNVF